MLNQGERQGFKWRPNDYSSTTLTRYDLEAEHWTKAFKNASNKHTAGDLDTSLRSIMDVVNLILSILSFILISLIYLVKWLRS